MNLLAAQFDNSIMVFQTLCYNFVPGQDAERDFPSLLSGPCSTTLLLFNISSLTCLIYCSVLNSVTSQGHRRNSWPVFPLAQLSAAAALQIGNWLLQSRQEQSIWLFPSLIFHTCNSDLEKAFFFSFSHVLKLVSFSTPSVDLTNTAAPPYKLYFYSYIFLPSTALSPPYFKADF